MRPRRRLKSEINVVPYIDVMLVLLVIFMVTAPMMPTGTVNLPTVGKATQVPVQPLEIGIGPDEQLTLTDRAKKTAKQQLSRAELKATVLALQADNPEQPVLIAGDKGVRYEAVLTVMDELQRAQVKRVGLLVHPTGQ
jgi:biopolymer transport protein TolR